MRAELENVVTGTVLGGVAGAETIGDVLMLGAGGRFADAAPAEVLAGCTGAVDPIAGSATGDETDASIWGLAALARGWPGIDWGESISWRPAEMAVGEDIAPGSELFSAVIGSIDWAT